MTPPTTRTARRNAFDAPVETARAVPADNATAMTCPLWIGRDRARCSGAPAIPARHGRGTRPCLAARLTSTRSRQSCSVCRTVDRRRTRSRGAGQRGLRRPRSGAESLPTRPLGKHVLRVSSFTHQLMKLQSSMVNNHASIYLYLGSRRFFRVDTRCIFSIFVFLGNVVYC